MPTDDAKVKHCEQWLSKADPNKSLSAYELAPDVVEVFGAVVADVIRNPVSAPRRDNLRMSHIYLVGDTSVEVQNYMM